MNPTKHFYMFLPSNADLALFPDNTASRFRVQLPHSIDLREGSDAHWEVALTELTCSQRLHTFLNEQLIVRQLEIGDEYKVLKRSNIPPGIHGNFDDAYFSLWYGPPRDPAAPKGSESRYKFSLLQPPTQLILPRHVAYQMGFITAADEDSFVVKSDSAFSVIEAPRAPPVPLRPVHWLVDAVQPTPTVDHVKRFTLPGGPPRRFDHGYFILDFNKKTDKISITNLDPLYRLRMTGHTAYEMGFYTREGTTDLLPDDLILRSGSKTDVIEAVKRVQADYQSVWPDARWHIDVVREDNIWVPRVVKETVVRMPSAYYPSGPAIQEAVMKAVTAAGVADSAQLTWDAKEARLSWRLTNPNNQKTEWTRALTDLARIEQDPGKPFTAEPVKTEARPFTGKTRVTALYMTGELALVLGMDTPFTMSPLTAGVLPPDPDRGVVNIYVYSNISRPVIVGNMLVPLLRSVAHQRAHKDGVVTYTFKRPYYVPVDTDMLSVIEILLCDDLGNPIPFLHGRTQAVLHFRLMSGPSATAAEALDV